ncbi:NAD(P)/FAD-dependent oxidoreductase [Streptomyces sp. SudanB66_2053]|uniref:NAD(P)/FAD-dependent oxidoreductase n=1 Tax=Streptomyces sp. SudanB66_2053 TaxID=3035277 RepID=UPI003F559306
MIIGGGVIGAAVFHELAERDVSVVLVERSRGGLGTTAWNGGIVRCYHNSTTLVERALVGWRYYRDFGTHTGIDVPFTESGFLYVPHADHLQHARRLVERAAEVPMEWLSRAEVEHHFGHLLNSPIDGAVWEPRAGHLDPLDVTRAYLRAGRRKGGRVMEGVEALDLLRTEDSGRFCGLRTSVGDISAGTVVLATGADTPKLLNAWAVPHDLWAQAIQVELRLPGTPVEAHPAYTDDVYDINGRSDSETAAILLGHPTGQHVPPRSGGLTADPVQSERAVAAATARFLWAAGSTSLGALRAAECYAPDDLARVGPISTVSGLLIATGFNGGGFKMAPWVATEVARLVDPV